MQIGIKPRSEAAGLTELLTDCHARIRSFIALAVRLGAAESPSSSEVREAAHAVHRYFGEALPLHVADEELTIEPRLRGRSSETDAALDRMSSEHRDHDDGLRSLLGLCETLSAEPERHRELAGRLLELATELTTAFEAHLRNEEDNLFPAIERWLDDDEQALMLGELRGRRAG